METRSARQKVIEEFASVHEEYLGALCEYVDPERRKPLIEESLREYQSRLGKFNAGECSVADITNDINAIKEARENLVYPRGECSPECFSALLRAQDLALAQLFISSKFQGEQRSILMVGVLELTNEIVSSAFRDILQVASEPGAAWEVRDKSHEISKEATRLILQLVDCIRNGNVSTVKLPSANKEKYKEFLN